MFLPIPSYAFLSSYSPGLFPDGLSWQFHLILLHGHTDSFSFFWSWSEGHHADQCAADSVPDLLVCNVVFIWNSEESPEASHFHCYAPLLQESRICMHKRKWIGPVLGGAWSSALPKYLQTVPLLWALLAWTLLRCWCCQGIWTGSLAQVVVQSQWSWYGWGQCCWLWVQSKYIRRIWSVTLYCNCMNLQKSSPPCLVHALCSQTIQL